MGLKQEMFWVLTCDECGESLGDELVSEFCEEEPEPLAWIAINRFSWVRKGEKWYCSKCQEKLGIESSEEN